MEVPNDWLPVITRHSVDIDKAHESIRAMSFDMEFFKQHLHSFESRFTAIEARIHEQRELLSTVHSDVMLIKSQSSDLNRLVQKSVELSERTQMMLIKHIHDETEEISKQSNLISQQSAAQTLAIANLSQRVIGLFTVSAALVALLAGLSGNAGVISILNAAMRLFNGVS